MRHLTRHVAHVLATVAVAPALVSYAVRRQLFGADRALEGSTEALSLIPGLPGVHLRRAFLGQVLAHCDRTVTIDFGTVFSQVGARLDANVRVGSHCHLGLVHLEPDVVLGTRVHVPSGPNTHGVTDVDRPIRDQPGTRTLVTIGAGSRIANGAIVLADVGRHSLVTAGAVVIEPLPDGVTAAGIPAQIVRERQGETRP